MFDAQLWLKTGSVVMRSTGTITTTPAQFFPRDPMRYAFTAPVDTAQTIFINFGGIGGSTPMLAIVPGSGVPVITRDQVGDLICEPIFIWATPGGSTAISQTVSYEPTKWRIYHEWIYKYLRNPGAV